MDIVLSLTRKATRDIKLDLTITNSTLFAHYNLVKKNTLQMIYTWYNFYFDACLVCVC